MALTRSPFLSKLKLFPLGKTASTAKIAANARLRANYQELQQMASGATAKRDRVILAYSGGLDTSVMVPWIGEKYNLDVVAFTVDLGQGEDIERIRQKALRTGAVDAIAIDARNLFVDLFVWPALMAGAVYEGKYPLATALGRPLIAKLMVAAAPEHHAKAFPPGCTRQGHTPARFPLPLPHPHPTPKITPP